MPQKPIPNLLGAPPTMPDMGMGINYGGAPNLGLPGPTGSGPIGSDLSALGGPNPVGERSGGSGTAMAMIGLMAGLAMGAMASKKGKPKRTAQAGSLERGGRSTGQRIGAGIGAGLQSGAEIYLQQTQAKAKAAADTATMDAKARAEAAKTTNATLDTMLKEGAISPEIYLKHKKSLELPEEGDIKAPALTPQQVREVRAIRDSDLPTKEQNDLIARMGIDLKLAAGIGKGSIGLAKEVISATGSPRNIFSEPTMQLAKRAVDRLATQEEIDQLPRLMELDRKAELARRAAEKDVASRRTTAAMLGHAKEIVWKTRQPQERYADFFPMDIQAEWVEEANRAFEQAQDVATLDQIAKMSKAQQDIYWGRRFMDPDMEPVVGATMTGLSGFAEKQYPGITGAVATEQEIRTDNQKMEREKITMDEMAIFIEQKYGVLPGEPGWEKFEDTFKGKTSAKGYEQWLQRQQRR